MVKPSKPTERFLLAVDHFAIDAFPKTPLWLSGKWVIYVDRRHVDQAWGTISANIKSGMLPYGAKVSTATRALAMRRHMAESYEARGGHAILVYTPNFLWRQNVKEVRSILASIGFRQRLYYKPNIFTDAPKRMPWVPPLCSSVIRYRYFG
jgi:hypothetical protein